MMDLQLYLESQPPKHLLAAVDDLVTYLERSGAAKLSGPMPPQGDPGTGIWIGRTPAARPFKERIENLDHDGYFMWGNGSRLVIAGKTPDGTVNGIYAFLERFIGIRWFAPGDLFELVPRAEGFKLPVVDEAFNPSFSLRILSGVPGAAGRDWLRRNHTDRSRPELPMGVFGHNLFNIFPAEEFGAKYPQIYALVNGRRILDQTPYRGQPCFSNPRTIQIAIQKARDFFDANPEASTFSLSVNDNMDFCQCPECKAFGVKEFRDRPIYSEVYFHFVDVVAKEILKTHPDRYLTALAYWGVELPPERIERLPKNVVIVLTQDTSQHHDPAYKEMDRGILTEWSKKCDHLLKYDYYGLGWLTPRYFPRLASEDLLFLRKLGGVGFYCEAYPFWPNIMPQLYATLRKLWNVERDLDELLEEFYTFFSPVSEEIREFFETLGEAWLKERPGRWFEGFLNVSEELQVMSLSEASRARASLQRALEGSSGNCQRRVRFLKEGFDFSYQLIRGYRTGIELRSLPISEETDVDGGLHLLREVKDSLREAETTHDGEIVENEAYPKVYFKDERFQRKFSLWKDFLGSSALVWLEAAHRFLVGRPGRWKELKENLPPDLAALAGAVEASYGSRNLIPQPDAEEVKRFGGEESPPQLARWLLSCKGCEFGFDESFSRSGKGSLRIRSPEGSRLSVFINVTPGKSYLVGAWTYAECGRGRMPTMKTTLLKELAEQPGDEFSTDLLQTGAQWWRLRSLVRIPREGWKILGLHFTSDSDTTLWLEEPSVVEMRG